MGRPTTSDVKSKTKTPFYLTEELRRAIEQGHIQVEGRLARRVDKTIFINSLIKTGLEHVDEIIEDLQ